MYRKRNGRRVGMDEVTGLLLMLLSNDEELIDFYERLEHDPNWEDNF